jgi:cell division protein FtsZ
VLLSITGGPDLSLIEASEAADIVRAAAHPEAEIIFGASVDEDMSEEVWITVIATRFDSAFAHRHRRGRRTEPREPRRPDRDAAQRPERFSDPVGDWRARPQVRHGSAEELYGDGKRGGGLDRRPTEPRPIDGRVLDVPEFTPED